MVTLKKDDIIVKLVRDHIRDGTHTQSEELFDEEPEEPRPQECCGQSCKPCVFDIHQEDLVRWAKTCAKSIKIEGNDLTLFDKIYGNGEKEEERCGLADFKLENYTPFFISSITKLTKTTSLFRFEAQGPDFNQNCCNIPLGSHLRARIPNLEQNSISRQYTPTECGKNWFEAPIKIYENGKFTSEIAKLNIGDRLDFRGPYGVEQAENIQKIPKMVYICGGTGIAPFVRIIEQKILEDNDDHIFRIIYCISNFDDLLFGQKLGEWARSWNFEITVFVSRPAGENNVMLEKWPHLLKLGNKEGRRMEKADFERILKDLRKFSKGEEDGVGVAVCGQTTFEKDVMNWALEAGIKSKNFIRFPP